MQNYCHNLLFRNKHNQVFIDKRTKMPCSGPKSIFDKSIELRLNTVFFIAKFVVIAINLASFRGSIEKLAKWGLFMDTMSNEPPMEESKFKMVINS